MAFFSGEKKKVIIYAIIALVAVVAGSWYLFSHGRNGSNTTALATTTVRRGTIKVTVSATGTVQPAVTKKIVAKASSTLKKIYVQEGSQVKKGDLLFELDTSSLESEIKKAELELKQAEQDYNNALNQRNQTAAQNNSPNSNNLQNQSSTTNNTATLELKVEQARLNLDSLKAKLNDYKIYAPDDGIITFGSSSQGQDSQGSSLSGLGFGNNSGNNTGTASNQPLAEGDYVNSGQTLATLLNTSSMLVTIAVDEVDVNKLQVGQGATITFDALPDKKFTGTIKEIAVQGNSQNGVTTFDVTVSIDNPEGIKPGMTANVEILVASKDNALLLPVEAVIERQGKKFVLVPDESGNAAPATSGTGQNNSRQSGRRMVPVETGLYNESLIEITSGLKEGDTVIIPSVTRTTTTNQNNRTPGGMPFFGGGNRTETGGSRFGEGFNR
ncbi:MAG: HlyD family secretion protein [Eubacteriales bacterium]|nr:HlyD family secretion protein [Eubacteriales bacterium]